MITIKSKTIKPTCKCRGGNGGCKSNLIKPSEIKVRISCGCQGGNGGCKPIQKSPFLKKIL